MSCFDELKLARNNVTRYVCHNDWDVLVWEEFYYVRSVLFNRAKGLPQSVVPLRSTCLSFVVSAEFMQSIARMGISQLVIIAFSAMTSFFKLVAFLALNGMLFAFALIQMSWKFYCMSFGVFIQRSNCVLSPIICVAASEAVPVAVLGYRLLSLRFSSAYSSQH